MTAFMPGDIIHPEGDEGLLLTVLALFPCGKVIVNDDWWTFPISEVIRVAHTEESTIQIPHSILMLLRTMKMCAPKFQDLQVGDWILLVNEGMARPALIASMDYTQSLVWTDSGELVPLTNQNVYMTGLRAE